MTDRIRVLHETRHDFYDRGEIPLRDRVYAESFLKNADDCRALKCAKAFEEFLSVKKILIRKEDVLAGYAYKYTYATTTPKSFPEDFDPSQGSPFAISDVSLEIESVLEHFGPAVGSSEAENLRMFVPAVKFWLYKHVPAGHIIADHTRILAKGYGALRAEAEAELEKARPKAEKDYIRAMLISARAVSNYILRYAEEARRLMRETEDPSLRAQLEKIAEATENAAYEPAGTFFEAVQLLWLTYEAIYAEGMQNCISAGRLDKYLYPDYERDYRRGLIDYDEASEIIDAFWLKFAVSPMTFQNITLGGLDANGEYIENPVTYMALRATRKFKDEQPLISLRYVEDIPDAFWEEIVATLLTGTGFPPLFNDKVFIPAKEKQGLSPEDAADYSIVGCVEMTGMGNDYSDTEALRLNIPLVLELMFNKGVQRASGVRFPLKRERSLDDIGSFGDFYEWFKDELKHFFLRGLEAAEAIQAMWGERYPNPFLSFTVNNCVKKGLDAAAGGAVYNNSTLNGGGFANAANALTAIRRAVFEDRLVTLEEFGEILAKNYEGREDFRAVVLSYPKYGNDDDDVDRYVKETVDLMHELVDDRINTRGGRYGIGIYTVSDHAEMGVHTGALPDGRLAGLSLSNGSGPSQGTDTNGPTAVINSVLKIGVDTVANGQVLDLKFTPSFLEKKSHRSALRHLINSYFRRGGGEIQFNVIGKDTLLAAQNDPTTYKDLVVRVSGFSAHFCNLSKATQDEIIARTEHDGF
jgi:formate C-acetyltransferase